MCGDGAAGGGSRGRQSLRATRSSVPVPRKRPKTRHRSYLSNDDFEEDRREQRRGGWMVRKVRRRPSAGPNAGLESLDVPSGCLEGPPALVLPVLVVPVVVGAIAWAGWRRHASAQRIDVEYVKADPQ